MIITYTVIKNGFTYPTVIGFNYRVNNHQVKTSVLEEENLNTRTAPVRQRGLIYFNTGDQNSPENL